MSAARKKGTAWETLLLPLLRQLWPSAERTGSAAFGAGDFARTAPFLIEAKACKAIDLAAFVDQASAAAAKLGTLPVVIVKRRLKPPEQAYVVMPLWAWLDYIAHTNRNDP